MRRIVEPLVNAGTHGCEWASGDGIVRQCHPILAAFVGDYPEQRLVTCCMNGQCLKCVVSLENIDDGILHNERNYQEARDTFARSDEHPRNLNEACRRIKLKPVFHPFWEDLPYIDIFKSITPDILHQLYQGIIKHLFSWLKTAIGADEIDARCARLPPNHHIRHFAKGISILSRVSGTEHQQISSILLGLVLDVQLPSGHSPVRLIRATRALLDFLYLAQYPSHTDDTLQYLEEALQTFHENRSIFVDIGICRNFRIPKFHSLLHYTKSIRYFSTTDNYNTKYTECLHIELAKEAYRATNRKEEYPQMTVWLERKEKVLRHHLFIEWHIAGQSTVSSFQRDDIKRHMHIKMARNPNVKAVKITTLVCSYGAHNFVDALAHFIVQYWSHGLMSRRAVEAQISAIFYNFKAVPMFYKIKFWNGDAQGLQDDTLDTVHVRPSFHSSDGQFMSQRFDTVLVRINGTQLETGPNGVEGTYSEVNIEC